MGRFLARLMAAAAVVLATSFPAAVHASGIAFSFQSTCTDNCALIGLNPGDAVFGSVLIADGAVVGGGVVDFGDILGVDLHFGTFTFALPTLADFNGTLNGSATQFTAYEFFASGTADGYYVSHFLWRAGPDPFNAAEGPGSPLIRAVPEPATLALVALALAGMAGARRRTRR